MFSNPVLRVDYSRFIAIDTLYSGQFTVRREW